MMFLMKAATFAVAFITAISCQAMPNQPEALAPEAFEEEEYYRQRYNVDNIYDKVVNNRGNGHENLYGVRNFRKIFDGLVYRGGANNYYHRSAKRDNRNPLPQDGLDNLCKEGFGLAIYLYTRNFENAPKVVNCTTREGKENTLVYMQRTSTDSNTLYDILRFNHETITEFKNGPVYMHCWNGWHASGLASATSLRQFCGWTGEQAVKYWDKNTDGVNKAPGYERIRQRIRDFTPYPEFEISAERQREICPQPR